MCMDVLNPRWFGPRVAPNSAPEVALIVSSLLVSVMQINNVNGINKHILEPCTATKVNHPIQVKLWNRYLGESEHASIDFWREQSNSKPIYSNRRLNFGNSQALFWCSVNKGSFLRDANWCFCGTCRLCTQHSATYSFGIYWVFKEIKVNWISPENLQKPFEFIIYRLSAGMRTTLIYFICILVDSVKLI